DIGLGGPLYRSEDGTAVAVHAEGIDLVVTGSVGEDDLVQVARSFSLTPLPAPAGWPESSAFSIDHIDAAAAGARPRLPSWLGRRGPRAGRLGRGGGDRPGRSRRAHRRVAGHRAGAGGGPRRPSGGGARADRSVQPDPRRAHVDRAGPRDRHVDPHGVARRVALAGRVDAMGDVIRRRWWVLLTVAGLILGMAAALLVDTGAPSAARRDPSTSQPSAPTATTPIEST